jgi:hypothetical protein
LIDVLVTQCDGCRRVTFITDRAGRLELCARCALEEISLAGPDDVEVVA